MEKAYDLIDAVTGAYGEPLKKAAAMDHFSAKYFPLIDRMAVSYTHLTLPTNSRV